MDRPARPCSGRRPLLMLAGGVAVLIALGIVLGFALGFPDDYKAGAQSLNADALLGGTIGGIASSASPPERSSVPEANWAAVRRAPHSGTSDPDARDNSASDRASHRRPGQHRELVLSRSDRHLARAGCVPACLPRGHRPARRHRARRGPACGQERPMACRHARVVYELTSPAGELRPRPSGVEQPPARRPASSPRVRGDRADFLSRDIRGAPG